MSTNPLPFPPPNRRPFLADLSPFLPSPRLLIAGALFIPTNTSHSILKVPWTKHVLQIGRGGHAEVGNDVVLAEKRVSNRHCRISLGIKELKEARIGMTEEDILDDLHSREEEPQVWLQDMQSSNGTFVSVRRR